MLEVDLTLLLSCFPFCVHHALPLYGTLIFPISSTFIRASVADQVPLLVVYYWENKCFSCRNVFPILISIFGQEFSANGIWFHGLFSIPWSRVIYFRSLLLKRNSYFTWQFYTTKQITCYSISLASKENGPKFHILREKSLTTKSSLWLINYRAHNLPLQIC